MPRTSLGSVPLIVGEDVNTSSSTQQMPLGVYAETERIVDKDFVEFLLTFRRALLLLIVWIEERCHIPEDKRHLRG